MRSQQDLEAAGPSLKVFLEIKYYCPRALQANTVKLQITPLLNTGGASTLQESLAGPIDTGNIKTRLRKTAKNIYAL